LKYLSYILFTFLININNANANELDKSTIIKDLQAEILNNNNIGKLEINYVYTKLFSIIERIEEESEPERLIYLDFQNISEYIEYLLDRDIERDELKKIWMSLLENPNNAKNHLLKGKDKILNFI
jgi:Glu-tRNA(Gln) amidotransferase subunit E-like FAD-binding protein